jgi:hypothetical protein
MSNPSTAIRWLIAAACCWPSPVAILFGVLIANAFQRGWLNIRIDRSKAPRLNWKRNAR